MFQVSSWGLLAFGVSRSLVKNVRFVQVSDQVLMAIMRLPCPPTHVLPCPPTPVLAPVCRMKASPSLISPSVQYGGVSDRPQGGNKTLYEG